MAYRKKAPMTPRTRICLIFGGRSAEHEVSLASATAVHRNLDPGRYDILCLLIGKDGLWRRVQAPGSPAEGAPASAAGSFLPWGPAAPDATLAADVYFPVLHGPNGEDGTIQGLLEMADVPYVGCGVTASALSMDKALSKSVFRDRGLPQVGFRVLLEQEWLRDRTAALRGLGETLPFPMFVKPSNLGSSVGITKAKDEATLEAALDLAFRYDRKVVVEEGVRCREIECSVLGNDEPRASLPGEVIPAGEFYDYRDKYIDGKTGFAIPADLPSQLVERVRREAVEAFKAVDGAGMARVDFLYAGDIDKLFLNEINTIPGFTEISMYPKLWAVSGLPFPGLLDELVRLALERHAQKRRLTERDVR
jgi:D-alanine-D-alanine ligase